MVATPLLADVARRTGLATADLRATQPAVAAAPLVRLLHSAVLHPGLQVEELLGEAEHTGWLLGSDGQRSPPHQFRLPGEPPYTGELPAPPHRS